RGRRRGLPGIPGRAVRGRGAESLSGARRKLAADKILRADTSHEGGCSVNFGIPSRLHHEPRAAPSPNRASMIRFDHVYKRYPNGREALSNVSLEVARGELVFVTGHSGAGKSSLLKLIALIERPTRGQLIVNGQNVAGVSRRKIPAFRRQIGMVFQDHKLLYDRTVFDNVALPLVIAGVRTKEIGKRVRAALDQVGLLGREQCLPLELSTGE